MVTDRETVHCSSLYITISLTQPYKKCTNTTFCNVNAHQAKI